MMGAGFGDLPRHRERPGEVAWSPTESAAVPMHSWGIVSQEEAVVVVRRKQEDQLRVEGLDLGAQPGDDTGNLIDHRRRRVHVALQGVWERQVSSAAVIGPLLRRPPRPILSATAAISSFDLDRVGDARHEAVRGSSTMEPGAGRTTP